MWYILKPPWLSVTFNQASATMIEFRVHRVRTNNGTVRYHHWGPKPHTRMKKLNPIDLVWIENKIMNYIWQHKWGGKTQHDFHPFNHSSTLIGQLIILIHTCLLSYSCMHLWLHSIPISYITPSVFHHSTTYTDWCVSVQ